MDWVSGAAAGRRRCALSGIGPAVVILVCVVGWQSGVAGSQLEQQCRREGVLDEGCVAERLDSEEALQAAFDAQPVPYRVVPSFLESQHAPHAHDVALCTQGSVDRLDRLRLQAESWGGSLSAAIYIRPPEAVEPLHSQILEEIRALHEAVEHAPSGCRLTISLLYALDPAEATTEFDTLFPINALRNVAVRAAGADLIMVIDMDFIPSERFFEYLALPEVWGEVRREAVEDKHVWALVSLELHAGYLALPADKHQEAASPIMTRLTPSCLTCFAPS
ncbi:hypothetical protein T484DRAFT_1781460 [Baffinella frigidus]|nr:hypothetical protein T484DRAFT_1781460 [Cryptophyta sp. CCMP2293]